MTFNERRTRSRLISHQRNALGFARLAPTRALRTHWLRAASSWREARLRHSRAVARAAQTAAEKAAARAALQRSAPRHAPNGEKLNKVISLRLDETTWRKLRVEALRQGLGASPAAMARKLIECALGYPYLPKRRRR